MAEHQSDCDICRRLAEARSGAQPGFIAELEAGVAVLGDSQLLPGYALLLCKTPATELDELPPAVLDEYLSEMTLLAQAVRSVVKPHKLNVEALGNQCHHLHWHVFPRTLDEPAPLQPVWLYPDALRAAPEHALSYHHAPMRDALRAELLRLVKQRNDAPPF